MSSTTKKPQYTSFRDLDSQDYQELAELQKDYEIITTLPSDDKETMVKYLRSQLGPSYRDTDSTATPGELFAFDAALNSERPFWGLISLAYEIPSDLVVSKELQEIGNRLTFRRWTKNFHEGLQGVEPTRQVIPTDDIVVTLMCGAYDTVKYVTYRHIRDGTQTPSWDVTGSYFMRVQPGEDCHFCSEIGSPYHTHSLLYASKTGEIESDDSTATLSRLATASLARVPSR